MCMWSDFSSGFMCGGGCTGCEMEGFREWGAEGDCDCRCDGGWTPRRFTPPLPTFRPSHAATIHPSNLRTVIQEFISKLLIVFHYHAAFKTQAVRDSSRSKTDMDATYLETLHARLQDLIPISRLSTNKNQRGQTIITTHKSSSHGR